MRVALHLWIDGMTMKKGLLVLALCPFAALAAEPQQPACNAADFFQTQPDLTVGRVVDEGNVALVGERPGCLDNPQDSCHSGDEVEPGSSLVIGSRWNDYYCVQVLPPGKEVVGWAPEQRVMKTGHMADTDFSSWLGQWDGSAGRVLEIQAEGDTLHLRILPSGGKGEGTLIGSAEPMGDELFLGEKPCSVRASLQGSELVLTDNGQCAIGGASPGGVYSSRAAAQRMERLFEGLGDR